MTDVTIADLINRAEAAGPLDLEPETSPSRKRPKSRSARWQDAAARAVEALEELREVQSEYQDWLDGLPENLQSGAVAEKLNAVVEIDLESATNTASEAQDADLPMGFGRD